MSTYRYCAGCGDPKPREAPCAHCGSLQSVNMTPAKARGIRETYQAMRAAQWQATYAGGPPLTAEERAAELDALGFGQS